MTSSFYPLYESLVINLQKKNLTSQQKLDLVSDIKNMDLEAQESVVTLILFYYMKEENGDFTKVKIPYTSSSSASWDINNIPEKLRKILFKFAELYKSKIKVDEIQKENEKKFTPTLKKSS